MRSTILAYCVALLLLARCSKRDATPVQPAATPSAQQTALPGQPGAPRAPAPDERLATLPPGQVAYEAYKAALEGRYSDTLSYSSKRLQSVFESQGAKETWHWAARTPNGEVSSIDIVKEQILGEGADVELLLNFKTGFVHRARASLIKEDGRWKLSSI